MKKLPLTSVIIPCFNQSRYVEDAIRSALDQRGARQEIIVVDDGSTDESVLVASKYPGIRLIRQQNQGLSAARNAGLAASAGDYLVFLDADDRLLPHALKTGANLLDDHLSCAFVYGQYRLIDSDGLPIRAEPRQRPHAHPYLDMLRFNYIGMHATVMYRRAVFNSIGAFDTSLGACEDYDLFLRIVRQFSIHCHDEVVAEYRQHGSNMSSSAALMLRSSLRVLHSQRRHINKNQQGKTAYRAGMKHWQRYYGEKLIRDLRRRIISREWSRLREDVLVLLRYYPRGLGSKALRRTLELVNRSSKSKGLQSPKIGGPRLVELTADLNLKGKHL
jgi:glycosyltransferase involved in cell wall biosynthesis